MAKIFITDVSSLPRFGIKGREASAWLSSQGISLPTIANTWTINKDSCLILRLGNSEFLIEDQKHSEITASLEANSKNRIAGLYTVARADASFILAGEPVADLLAEICMLDVCQDTHPHALYMTQVAGISATLLQQQLDGKTIIRLWCDGTYHHYMLETLSMIANEVGSFEFGLV